MPELLQASEKIVVPLPAVLRMMPSFANKGFPLFGTNAVPSPARSRVPLALLLKTAVLKATEAPSHVAVPLLMSVPLDINLENPPLIVRLPFAVTLRVDPDPPKVPPVHEKSPETATDMVPWRIPWERFNAEGERFPLPLKETLPPVTLSGALFMMHVPS